MTKIPCFYRTGKTHFLQNSKKKFRPSDPVSPHSFTVEKQFSFWPRLFCRFFCWFGLGGLVRKGYFFVPAMDDNGTGAASVGFVHLPVTRDWMT
jgi:hypothetical protein